LIYTATLECVLGNCNIRLSSLAPDDNNAEIEVNPRDVTEENSFFCPKAFFNQNFEFARVVEVSTCISSPQETLMWKLCSALWDPLEIDLSNLGFKDEEVEKIETSLRKYRVSGWLKETCTESLARELSKSKSPIENVFIHLTGNALGAAVKEAISSKDFRLATVLSQLPSLVSVVSKAGVFTPGGVPYRRGMDLDVLKDLKSQIEIWKKSGHLDLFSEKHKAVWTLVCGSLKEWDQSVLDPSFEWMRVFGMFLWFVEGGNLSLCDALEVYTSNFEDHPLVRKPTSDFSKDHFDICFHLLSLYRDSSSLEEALNPLTHSADPLDYRRAWLLGNLISKNTSILFRDVVGWEVEDETEDGVGNQIHTQSTTQDVITFHFIAQLEKRGLWKWAIFVSLFLSFHTHREAKVRELLCRYYPHDDDSGSFFPKEGFGMISEEYSFLTEKLLVPATWIHEAKVLFSPSI
jgi:nuclear pore complex protein Nup98-Nup96